MACGGVRASPPPPAGAGAGAGASAGASASASAAPSYAGLLTARVAKVRRKGTDVEGYARDRAEVDAALTSVRGAADADAVIATAPGAGAGAGAKVVCQITRKMMTDPVRSTECGHVYERAAILQCLKGKPSCPMAGCKKPLVAAQLVDDADTKYRIEQEKKRRADAGEDEGDGDDDDDGGSDGD